MQAFIEYQGETLCYSILTNRRLKHFYIQIHPQKGVIVKNPGFSQERVEMLVLEKISWIFSKVRDLRLRNDIAALFQNDGKVLYLGESILLPSSQTPERFYKEKTPPLVLRLVEEWSFLMSVKPGKISFRKAKKRWGSCSHQNDLSFNLSLAQLPLECMTYIVIHELAHILHKHHQKAFWECVKSYLPDYKACEKQLRAFSPAL
jgi:hypothetical protein